MKKYNTSGCKEDRDYKKYLKTLKMIQDLESAIYTSDDTIEEDYLSYLED